MKHSSRLLGSLSAMLAAFLFSGCVAVPADPAYGGYAYASDAAYVGSVGYYGGPPVVVAPPPLSIGIHGIFSGHRGHHAHGPRHGFRGHHGWRGNGGRYHGWRGHGGHRGGFGGGHRGGGGRGHR